LRADLESIVRQSVRCDLVVVDCGSVDDSKTVASDFAGLVLNAPPSRTLQPNVATLVMKTAEFASGGLGYVLSCAPKSAKG
jgi:hypothetical protein